MANGSSLPHLLDTPTWSNWREALRVVAYRPHLKKTSRIALMVGMILFGINQLDVVLQGQATAAVWVKASVTFLVPFCVSNLGILVATRRRVYNSRAIPPGQAVEEIPTERETLSENRQS